MALELKPLKDILTAGKEALKTMFAPVRERILKSQLEIEMATLEGKIMQRQNDLQEIFLSFADDKKNVDFNAIADVMDDIEILQGRAVQFADMMSQLFPTGPAVTPAI